MFELQDVIMRDSDKQFRLRIKGILRSIGVSQIIGTKNYLEIEFIGGELSVRIYYPRKLQDLNEAIRRKKTYKKNEWERTVYKNSVGFESMKYMGTVVIFKKNRFYNI